MNTGSLTLGGLAFTLDTAEPAKLCSDHLQCWRPTVIARVRSLTSQGRRDCVSPSHYLVGLPSLPVRPWFRRRTVLPSLPPSYIHRTWFSGRRKRTRLCSSFATGLARPEARFVLHPCEGRGSTEVIETGGPEKTLIGISSSVPSSLEPSSVASKMAWYNIHLTAF